MSSSNGNDASAFSTDQVQSVAHRDGYVIITKRSKTKTSGYVYKVVLMCDRGGVYKSTQMETSTKTVSSKKTNCPFELAGLYSKTNDFWMLRVIRDEHNHEPALYMEGHSYAKRLTDDELHLVADLMSKNIKPREMLATLHGNNKNSATTIKIVYNAIQKIRMNMAAGRTPMQVLFSNLQDKGYTFEFRKNEDSHELEELFFIHPVSLEIWRAFPHVLFMDATYKTNKYNLPFLQIIGVTSTCLSFCIAYVFIHNEKECNYNWR